MPRIAKPDVHAALQRAADQIANAGGGDGRVSRADIAEKLATLHGTERALVDIFYRFIDQRDAASGAQVTAKDIRAAVEYAEQELIDRYDLNHNGLSETEIASMETVGRLAVMLARELAAAAAASPLTESRAAIDGLLAGLHAAVENRDITGVMGCFAGSVWESLDDPTVGHPLSYANTRRHFETMFASLRDIHFDGLATGDGMGNPYPITGNADEVYARVNDYTPLSATVADTGGGYAWIGDGDFTPGDAWYEERSEDWYVFDIKVVNGEPKIVGFGQGNQ